MSDPFQPTLQYLHQIWEVKSQIQNLETEAKDYYLKRLPRRLLLADQKVDTLGMELGKAQDYVQQLMTENQNNSYIDNSRVCTIPENILNDRCKIDYVEKGECGCYDIIHYRYLDYYDGSSYWNPQSPESVKCPSCKMNYLLEHQKKLFRLQQGVNQERVIATQKRIDILKKRISDQNDLVELNELEELLNVIKPKV